MVTRSEKGFLIEVPVIGNHPAEEYTETLNELIDLLQGQSGDMQSNHYHVFELIRAMLPNFEQAQNIMDVDTDRSTVRELHARSVLKCCK